MFGTDNVIEPIALAAVRARPVGRRPLDEPPIREASSAEVARASRRRDAESLDRDRNPVRVADVPSRIAGLFRRRQVEPVQPDEVARRHGLYVTERRNIRTYFADYQQKQEVMRADPKRITTNQSDRQTVSAMLDLAEHRGWQTVRLRGNIDFKREAWVQAQVRGIETEGYEATATDAQEVARRLNAVAPKEGPGERAAVSDSPRIKIGEIPGHVKPENREVGPEETALRQKMGMPVHQSAKAASQAPVAASAARATSAPIPSPAESPAKVAPVAPKATRKASAKVAPAAKPDTTIVTSNVAPAEMSRMATDLGIPVKGSETGLTTHPVKAATKPEDVPKAVETAKPVVLSDQQVDRMRRDAETLGAVWQAVRDPNVDPARVREALEREPPADRQRLTAEVMAGLERRATETGSRVELERIAPHLPGYESSVNRVAIQQAQPPQAQQAARVTSDELAAARAIPADVAAYDARIAAMTPEQREALGRAAYGSLYKLARQEVAGGAPAATSAVAQDRQKAVWGNVEAAGRTAREAARAEAPAAKAGERAKAEAV